MYYKVGRMDILTDYSGNQKVSKAWVLIYVRSGAGIYMFEGHLKAFDQSDILLLPPSASVSFDSSVLGDEYNANVDAVVIRFDAQWLDGLIRIFPRYSPVVMALKELRAPSVVTGLKWLKISDLMNRILTSSSNQEAALTLEILETLADPAEVVQLADKVIPIPDTGEKLSKVARFISCNLHRKFSLDEIADYAGMNRTYFCLFFKKHYGISLTDHVNRLRVDMACAMLDDGKSTISETALACGFPTVTYFNRIFKKIKGITPREFRSQVSPRVP